MSDMISIRIDGKTLAHLDRLAIDGERTRSQQIRYLINRAYAVDELEKFQRRGLVTSEEAERLEVEG